MAMHALVEKPSPLGFMKLELGRRIRLKIRFLNPNIWMACWDHRWEYSCLGKLFLKKKNKAKAHKQKPSGRWGLFGGLT